MIRIELTQDFPIEIDQSYDNVYIRFTRPRPGISGILLKTTEARQIAGALNIIAEEADRVPTRGPNLGKKYEG